MHIKHKILHPKTQTKANDCWYACIQIIQSVKAGAKTKTAGATAQNHRSIPVFGRTLSFGSAQGLQIMADNNLKNVSASLRLNDVMSLYNSLQANGPLIVGGQFGIFNTQGHFFVIYGCDTATGEVKIYDPFWAHGKTKKDWGYITQHIWRNAPNGNYPASYAVIACA